MIETQTFKTVLVHTNRKIGERLYRAVVGW